MAFFLHAHRVWEEERVTPLHLGPGSFSFSESRFAARVETSKTNEDPRGAPKRACCSIFSNHAQSKSVGKINREVGQLAG